MGFCTIMIRAVLIIFNILFLLAGLLLLGFGAALKAVPFKLFSFFTNVFKDETTAIQNGMGESTDIIAYFMIVLGIVTFLIALFGIVGAVTLSKCPLITYVIIVIIVLLAQIALIVVVTIVPQTVQQEMTKDFKDFDSKFISFSDPHYITAPPKDPVGRFWYIIQNSFECCGMSTDTKFEGDKSVYVEAGVTAFNLTVPSSCCKQNPENEKLGRGFPLPAWNTTAMLLNFGKCKEGITGSYNNEGCVDKFLSGANKLPIIIGGIILGFEVILIIFSIVALCINSDKESV